MIGFAFLAQITYSTKCLFIVSGSLGSKARIKNKALTPAALRTAMKDSDFPFKVIIWRHAVDHTAALARLLLLACGPIWGNILHLW